MKLGEFFIDLVVNAGSGELTVKNLISSMGELQAVTVGEIGVLYELGVRLAAITDASIKSALGLEDYASKTGESTVALQEWQAAAEKAHVSGSTVTGTFDKLSRSLTKYNKVGIMEGPLKGAVAWLGIDPSGKDVYKVMDEISNKLRSRYKDQATRRYVVEDIMGFDPAMLRLLDKTAAERAKDAEGAYIMSEKQQKTFLEIEGEMINIQRAAALLGHTIADWAAPNLVTGLQYAMKIIKEIEREFETHSGIVGKVIDIGKMSASGLGMLPQLVGEKSWGSLFKHGAQGIDEIDSMSRRGTGWRDIFTGIDASIAASGKAFLQSTGQLPTPAVAGHKSFHNIFHFGNITKAEEARKATVGIMQDQNDFTDALIGNGAKQ